MINGILGILLTMVLPSLLTNNGNYGGLHGCSLIGLTLPDGANFVELNTFYSPKSIVDQWKILACPFKNKINF